MGDDHRAAALMAGELHELSVAIGRLQADVRSLAEYFHDEREYFHDERAVAARERHELREAIDRVSSSMLLLSHEVQTMKPLVFDYQKERDEAKGAARYRRWLWSIMSAAIATALSVFFDLARLLGFRSPPHP